MLAVESKDMRQRIVQAGGAIAVWVVGTFLGAHRLGWARGWAAVALYFAGITAIALVEGRYNPGLFEARARFRRHETKWFDKVFFPLMLPLTFAEPAVAGWDAGCAGCTAMSMALFYPGAILVLLASAVFAWVVAVNPFAETTVRIQTERGHKVITRGPYRFVRHPMYVGALLLYIGLPMVWGSRWAAALSAAVIVLFIWRTALEDRTLRRELPGYEEYAARTRNRLLPRIW
jgi:protein-S-isoprenylcysteine O-methyltransferase Ste14